MRTPEYPNIFSCLVGIGAQIGLMCYITLAYLVLFFADVSYRPYVFTAGMSILSMTGCLNGFITTRTLKSFGATDWIFSAVISAMVLPIWTFSTIGLADSIELMARASMPTSIGGGMGYTIFWFIVNSVTCFIGAYFGYLSKM